MKRFLLALTALCGIAVTTGAQSLEPLLRSLDGVIARKEDYNRSKEERIDMIRYSLSGIEGGSYSLYDALYQEYSKFNLDSAYRYARDKVALAPDEKTRNQSMLDQADICINAGMYEQARDLAEAVTVHDASFYHTMHTLYTALAVSTAFRGQAEIYSREQRLYRDSLIISLPHGDTGHVYALAEKLNEEGRYAEAIDSLMLAYSAPGTLDSEKAILDYCLAVAWKGLGNREEAERHYTASAITDIRTPVKEYRSLHELAYMLYEDGDLSRAYRYITCAMEDVQASNTIIRTLEFTPFLATISEAYEKDIRHRSKVQIRLLYGLIALSLLLLLLAAAMLVQGRSLRASNQALSRANEKLKEITGQLQETGYVKEEYLYQYMEQAAASIDKIETYRRKILLSYRKYGAEKMAAEMEEPLDVENELRNFYHSFDETFLHLFPTFVDDVNRLLKSEQHLEPKPGRLMNTELRILALIRLGVTDNVKMAHFLRTSLSTIYNYRSKLRNAALDDPGTFEEQVGRIGKPAIE